MQDNSVVVEQEEEEEEFEDSDFVDAIQLTKRRVKRRIERCFVCKNRVEAKDLFRPCNCEFGYMHSECLRRWMQERQVCRICLNNYDILNAPNSCGICRKFVADEDNVRSCKCRFRKHHKDCIQKNVESNYNRCLYCKEDYATTQTVSWRLTSKYLQKTFCCIGKALIVMGKILYVLLWLAIFAALMAPQNILANRWNLLETISSFVLFPGNDQFPLWLDIVYLIFTAILYGLALVMTFMGYTESEGGVRSLWVLTPAIIPVLLLHHLVGNIHYQFYCAISVIPSVNCQWMISLQTLFAGPTFTYPPMFIYLLFLCFRQICCKKVITTTIVDLEEQR